MEKEYLFDKEWYELMLKDTKYVAGYKEKSGSFNFNKNTLNSDLKMCIENQLKYMKEKNIAEPMYITTAERDIYGTYYVKQIGAIQVKYCANCYRQIDANDLDKIEIIDDMCFHKEDCQ